MAKAATEAERCGVLQRLMSAYGLAPENKWLNVCIKLQSEDKSQKWEFGYKMSPHLENLQLKP